MDLYRRGGSDRHLRDFAPMPEISGEAIDRAGIGEWAERLGPVVWEARVARVDERDRPSGL